MNRIEKMQTLYNGLQETYVRKNHDYGNSFEESLNEFGLVASLVRLSDKFNRMKQLAKDCDIQVKDEKIRDTMLDAANYLVMTVMWLDQLHQPLLTSTFKHFYIKEKKFYIKVFEGRCEKWLVKLRGT